MIKPTNRKEQRMNFKCPHCQKALEMQVKGVETKSAMDVFNQAFGGNPASANKKPTLNDEMSLITAMKIGDTIDWGGGLLARVNEEVWKYSHDRIDGGVQYFSAHVDLRSMAMKYPMVKEDFIDRMSVKFWTSDYDWTPPDDRPYNGFTGFTNQQVHDGIVDCTQIGYQGMLESPSSC